MTPRRTRRLFGAVLFIVAALLALAVPAFGQSKEPNTITLKRVDSTDSSDVRVAFNWSGPDDQASGVSREHCEIVLRDGELKLSDLSRFGTFVNEKRISGETTLQRADVIRIGTPGAELQVVSMEPTRGAQA